MVRENYLLHNVCRSIYYLNGLYLAKEYTIWAVPLYWAILSVEVNGLIPITSISHFDEKP
jgi:hypothetical protein